MTLRYKSLLLDSLNAYCDMASSVTGIDAKIIERYALDALWYFRSDRREQAALKETRVLERDWYRSLPNPDYSLYKRQEFLGDLWACWRIYSRGYIQLLRRHQLLESRGVESLVDVGNGIGFSTAYLRELFPQIKIYGTNLPSYQMEIGKVMAEKYEFTMLNDDDSLHVDAIFASEYFEHFDAPCDHLDCLIKRFSPKMIICANAFGAESFGHFPQYRVGERVVDNKKIGRYFGKHLRSHHQFKSIETGFWNNRPAVFVRES